MAARDLVAGMSQPRAGTNLVIQSPQVALAVVRGSLTATLVEDHSPPLT